MSLIRKRRNRLFKRQIGLCFWCGVVMDNPDRSGEFKYRPKDNDVTLDHLDDRFSPLRGTFVAQERTVAACWRCNQNRCKESLRENIDEQRRRAERGKKS